MEENSRRIPENRHKPVFKIFDGTNNDNEYSMSPNPELEDGKVLPADLKKNLEQEDKLCVRLNEIDPYYYNKGVKSTYY